MTDRPARLLAADGIGASIQAEVISGSLRAVNEPETDESTDYYVRPHRSIKVDWNTVVGNRD